ncbi:selenocysteine-specific elongation factor SelB [Halobacteroides halobius DSM 5150]|uniref:Selenocysteine-specific elongation factor n=1 Tax=Halobacteroides halobius (strain ATCC 35273 / DSM 5150 / MD-1) TaxID=748449 RepID=L0KAL9_HALHC|nr:selenocysteine-specific translation elongation factor [Halobacteroides halobius]AGB42061.1 selenocysteine-specific elongation factor SelB [Halobacteroides halobius DSM 5150]
MSKNLIIGTAGHVDHGKTTLIKALTGQDTDRLDEENERGVSIELGFSHLELNDDLQVGIIDVPGHEKFIKNMLAGAGGVDLGLLVVAADEIIMQQTREHLEILDLLNVKQGLIAVTKSDLVDDEWLNLVIYEIKEAVKDTFLEGTSVIPVSAVEETGIDKLKEEIEEVIADIPTKDKTGNTYFPIDRVFSLTGHGTIVTGTLLKGQIKEGAKLRIYPSGIDVRVRSLQVHEKGVETAYPGQRVGINLSGVDTKEVDRGDVLATKESLVKTEYLDARLEMLSSAPLILKHGDRIRLHLGAEEVLGRVYLLDNEELYPGEEGLVQFRLEEEVVANFKERYVIRRYSPMTTIGGGQILESNPIRHRKFEEDTIKALKIKEVGSSKERIELALKRNTSKPLSIEELIQITSLSTKQLSNKLASLVEDGRVVELATGRESSWLHQSHIQQLREEIISYLQDYHQQYHLRWGIDKEELRTKLSLRLDSNQYDLLLADLKQTNKIEEQDAKLSLENFEVEFNLEEEKIKEEILTSFNAQGFQPPRLEKVISDFANEDLATEIVDFLITNNKLVKVAENLYLHHQVLDKAKSLLREYLIKEGQISLAQFRDLLNSSRKYALPLLDYFDKQGVTKREGDIRHLEDK